MNTYRIAAIPGDGIGPEVIPEGIRVLQAAANRYGFQVEVTEFPWGCGYYLKHGVMMPPDGLDQLRKFDAILMGAVGDPRVPDHVSLWGLLLRIRKGFDLYVNLRPVRLLEGVPGPLVGRRPEDVDMVFVRENTEGEYAGVGGRVAEGTADEVALQTSVYTRRGTERVVRYAFELARRRRRQLASVTKSNALQYTAVLWDEVTESLSREYPDVQVWRVLVDAACYHMVLNPQRFDVVVGSNLYADILTDLGAALQGSLGLAASANLDPTRRNPSLFEPVHGSAPDIAGRGIANPLATIWSVSLMLEHLGETKAAAAVFEAVQAVVREPALHPPDLGGRATTQAVADAVVEVLR